MTRFARFSSGRELKVIDTAQAQYACTTTGSVTLLNGVATGTDFTNRIGRKIIMKSVQIRGMVRPATSTPTSAVCRVIIGYDMQPNTALPAVTDVLLAATGDSMLNLNNRDRFKMLMDKQVTMGFYNTTASSSVADHTVVNVKKYIKLNHDTIFDGTTAAIGDITSGSLFLLTVGTLASGWEILCTLRVRFEDA